MSACARRGAVRGRARARERRLAELGVLATVVIWSANFVVAKAAVEALGPLTFTSLRYVVATATLFLLVRWRLGPVRPPGRTALALIGPGDARASAATSCCGARPDADHRRRLRPDRRRAPVLTVLLAGAVGMDRLTPPKLAGRAGRVRGRRRRGRPRATELSLGASLVGELLTLGAAVLWAVYTIAGTRMLRQVDPLQATAWAVLGGTLFLLPFGAHEIATSPPPEVSPAAVLGILYSGAFAAAVANVLVFNAIRLVGPSRVTVSQFLVPAGAVVLGAVFLAEPVGIAQVAGGAVIVFGVWLTRRPVLLPTAMRARMAR